MARTITWDDLRRLAGVEARDGCAISLYLNLDPSVAPTAGDAASRLNSLLDEAAKSDAATREDLSHDARQAVRADVERIRRFYDEEFSREGTRGLAVFCVGGDGVWHVLELIDPVEDSVKVDRQLYLAPLVPLVGRGSGAVVVALSRERGQLYRLEHGRLEEMTDLSDRQPRRHDQGGWSQARMQRHIDGLAEEHMREVAEELDRLVRQVRDVRVVVAADEQAWAEFAELLSQEARAAVAGWTRAESHAGPADLAELAAPVLEEWQAAKQREILEQWRQEAGRDGRASSGWAGTLAAASDARVELLLFQEGVEHDAWRCPQCGRVEGAAGECPLDGVALEHREDGLDLAIRQTLSTGGSVWAVRDAQDLEPVEGIGALLRY